MDYEKVSEKKWEEIVLKSDNAYFFHSPIWAKILEKTYDYCTATRLYHVNDKSILIPMMEKDTRGLKSFSSMPSSPGYGGFFSASNISIYDIKDLINDIIGGRNVSFNLSLPPYVDISSDRSAMKMKNEWKVQYRHEWGNYTHVLSLDEKNYEDIVNNYSDSTKQHLHQAIELGLKIREGTTLDDFRTYYDFYAAEARQNWGFENPPHSFEFFRNLHKCGSPHVKLSLVSKDNQTIAGVLSFHYARTIYSFGGYFSDDYETLYPTKMLFNSLIKQAFQEDYKYIDFGPSGKVKCEKFKKGFGAEEVEIKRYRVSSKFAKFLHMINKSLRVHSP